MSVQADRWVLDIGFHFDNTHISSGWYGKTYLTEFLNNIAAFSTKSEEVRFLEWGCGLTTIALARNARKLRLASVVSYETDDLYGAAVRAEVNDPLIQIIIEDLTGSWTDKGLAYSTAPLETARDANFIYIDGRRRLECAMIALLLGDGSQTVMLHDHRRERYQPVDAFYDVLDASSHFKVMRPRTSVLAALRCSVPRPDSDTAHR